ncbi:hypothetical protein LSH36_589g01086 [Paralvinella palmiformis]|uniref:Uncharacterized protein n=1 Tax=Paralvinella palmiformis TaxID=53620 RepID=A0AAD9J5V1_9ANNE|nr:hypothetical protein LSH36_589g01086 [Paralvinella palmiformis]
MSCLELLSWLIVVYISYKLIDYLLRLPYVLGRLNRYIFITGCDTGFGHELAKDLDRNGYNVFAGCLTEDGEDILRKQCTCRLKTVHIDVSNPESVRQAYQFVKDNIPEGKGLWGLVNNAGIAGQIGPLDWLHLADYKRCFDVNLFGLIDTTVTFLPLIKQGKGRIVNAASVFGRIAISGMPPYILSKYGVEAFSDILRRQLIDYHCTVHIIEPGFHKTNMINTGELLRSIDAAWNRLTLEKREEYGEEYLETIKNISIKKGVTKMSSLRINDVVDAYKHALLAMFPRARYIVGLDAKYVWLPLQMLPEWMSDYILVTANKLRPVARVKRGNTGLDIIKDVVGGLSVGLSDSTPSAKRPVTVSDYIDCMYPRAHLLICYKNGQITPPFPMKMEYRQPPVKAAVAKSRKDKMSCLELLSWLIVVYISYKLIDYLLRLPYVLGRLNRYILITGCDTGFGHEVAKDLDRNGYNVFAGCLTEVGEDILRKQCTCRLKTVHMDVSNPESIRQAYQFVKDNIPEGKGLWGLVNNAGIVGQLGPLDWLYLSDYKRCFDVNLFGLIDTTVTFLPLIKQEKGRIVNTASVFGRTVIAGVAPYVLSKYGVEAFSDILRRQLIDYGCTVHIIEPGFHKTNITNTDALLRAIDVVWNRLTPEQREEYGEEYLETTKNISIKKGVTKMSSLRINDVVDAYKHALLAMFPRARYVVGLDAKYFWLPLQMLPEWMSDYIFVTANKLRPVARVVRQK